MPLLASRPGVRLLTELLSVNERPGLEAMPLQAVASCACSVYDFAGEPHPQNCKTVDRSY